MVAVTSHCSEGGRGNGPMQPNKWTAILKENGEQRWIFLSFFFFFTENKIYCSKEGEVVMGLLLNTLYLQNSHN